MAVYLPAMKFSIAETILFRVNMECSFNYPDRSIHFTGKEKPGAVFIINPRSTAPKDRQRWWRKISPPLLNTERFRLHNGRMMPMNRAQMIFGPQSKTYTMHNS